MATSSGSLSELHQIKLPRVAANPSVSEMLHRAEMLDRQADGAIDFDQVSRLGLDGYRVALIPSEEHFRSDRTDVAKRAAPLILPLTWKQLRMLATGESGYIGRKANWFQFGEVHIDFESMEVRRGQTTVVLTCMEFKLLKFMVLNPSRVISRDALLNQVWGYNNYPQTRTVDNHILRLRRKLESDISHPVHFQTVHGVGYKFIPHAQSKSAGPPRGAGETCPNAVAATGAWGI
jgi:DNA-binding response OmpR family regulator